MWERGEKTAIWIGLDLDTYWEIDPKTFNKYVEVYIEKEKRKAKELDYNNFSLGNYIRIAFNDPKKYPRKPFSYKEEPEVKVMTGSEMERMAKYNTIRLGGKVK